MKKIIVFLNDLSHIISHRIPFPIMHLGFVPGGVTVAPAFSSRCCLELVKLLLSAFALTSKVKHKLVRTIKQISINQPLYILGDWV